MIEWDIVVVGGANTDCVIRGPRLPTPGETVEGGPFQQEAGGKGNNQAVAAARLGARVALIARVGDDRRGTALIETLAREGVETRFIKRDPDAPTGAALIQVSEKGEKQIMAAPGANHRLIPVETPPEPIRRARVLLVQLEIPLESVMAAVRNAHEAGVRVVLDPAPARPLPDELLQQVEAVRPNAKEAKTLTGVEVRDRAFARVAAERLLKRGAKVAAVQAGPEGNLLLWREGECWLPKIPVKRVDATGAGDAFAAALAVGMAEGRSWGEIGPFANAAAALATTRLGAQPALPRREEVEALLAELTAAPPKTVNW